MEARTQIGQKARIVLALAAAWVAFAGSAGASWHLRLTDSLPTQDQTVTESPPEIRVWFNQKISLPVSRLALEGPPGRVSLGRVEATDDPNSFKAAVSDTLQVGTYTVAWRTAGPDGHVQRGEFSFSMVDTERR